MVIITVLKPYDVFTSEKTEEVQRICDEMRSKGIISLIPNSTSQYGIVSSVWVIPSQQVIEPGGIWYTQNIVPNMPKGSKLVYASCNLRARSSYTPIVVQTMINDAEEFKYITVFNNVGTDPFTLKITHVVEVFFIVKLGGREEDG